MIKHVDQKEDGLIEVKIGVLSANFPTHPVPAGHPSLMFITFPISHLYYQIIKVACKRDRHHVLTKEALKTFLFC